MHALFIENGISTGGTRTPGISGGDVLIIQLARRWQARGIEVHFMTTSDGVEVCRALGLDAEFHELPGRYVYTSGSFAVNVFRNLIRLPLELERQELDFVVTSNEYLYNVFPGYKLKKIHDGKTTWASIIHFVPRYPWERTRAGASKAAFGFLNHYLGARIIRRWSDASFAVSEQTMKDYQEKMHFSGAKVHAIPAGIDYGIAREAAASAQKKEYDGLFLGRIHAPKGIYDLLPIWKEVTSRVPDAKLAIIGTGPDDVVRDFQRRVGKEHLEKNIDLIGPVYDARRKYELIARSRVLLLPSYEENWAMVVGEALACEVPVVAYDLAKLRQVWGPFLRYAEIGATEEFADEVVKLFDRNDARKTIDFKAALEFVSAFDWDKIADDMLRVLAPNLPALG